MKKIIVLSLVTLLLTTGCPPPEPDPMPVNSFTFRHNVPGRLVIEFEMGYGSDSMGYAYGPNLLSGPLLNGDSVRVEDLRVGTYQLRVTSVPLGIGSAAVSYYDWGEIAADSQALISYSAMYP